MAKKNKYTNIPKVGEVQKNQLDESGTFMIVNVEDKYRIGMAGRWMTKQIFNTPEEAEAYIASKPWELIMNLAGTIAEYAIQNTLKELTKELGVSTAEPVKE